MLNINTIFKLYKQKEFNLVYFVGPPVRLMSNKTSQHSDFSEAELSMKLIK